MATIDLSGNNLKRTAFNGVQGLVREYNIRGITVLQTPKNNYQIDQLTTQDTELYKSSLGTPVLTDLTFQGGSYTDENGALQSFDQIVLETVLITISQTKNIVKTPIQGRPGTVKEYIGLGDYVMTINGIITGPNGSYPKDDIVSLKNMLVAPVPIQLTSWYVQLWDINNIIVDDFSINPEEGGYSYQPFTIDATSDYYSPLRINSPISIN